MTVYGTLAPKFGIKKSLLFVLFHGIYLKPQTVLFHLQNKCIKLIDYVRNISAAANVSFRIVMIYMYTY
jgi:hypothetical protein